MRSAERARRLDALRRRLTSEGLDALIVSAPANIRYLSGFTGSLAYLLVGASDLAEVLGDSRYWVQMEEEAIDFTPVRSGPSSELFGLLPERIQRHRLRTVGFEAQHLSVALHDTLRSGLDGEVELKAASGLVEELRMLKAPEETELLRTAAGITSRAFDRVAAAIRPGLTERDVAFLLEQTFRELGAEGNAFESIVAGGERGALPHARASDRVLHPGEMIVMDFGARAGGYNADISRTVVLGEPTPQQNKALEAVRNAQTAALQATRPGVEVEVLDRLARDRVVEEMGVEACFGHALGHGIGLEVHERPRVGRSDHTVLQAGMVVTNEPGVYIPGWGGVRIEEMVLVTDHGYELLSSATHRVSLGA